MERVSFDEFYTAEYRRVLALTASLTGSRAMGEEVAQEAFLAAYRDWARVGAMDAPGAWIRRVASNTAISTFRRISSEHRAVSRLDRPAAQGGLDEVVQNDVWSAVRSLPVRQAQAIALTYLAGMSRREVARAMQCSEETVKTHLSRARTALASSLGEEVADD